MEEIEEEIASEILKNQRQDIEKRLAGLKEIKDARGPTAAIFHLKEEVVGKKKTGQEACTVVDPNTGNNVFDHEEIREVCLEYCANLLENFPPDKEYVLENSTTSLVHAVIMEESDHPDPILTEDDFNNVVKRIQMKKKEKYKFFLQAGNGYRDAIFQLFSIVWQGEIKPDQWRNTTILQLYKGKGSANELGNQRGLHLKMDIPKVFETLVVDKSKLLIIEKYSKFQIAMPGHQAQEHIFTLKSTIEFYNYIDKPIIIKLYNLSKFFYKEVLADCMNTLYSAGVKGKLYRLWHTLNCDTIIQVNTAVGMSKKSETGANVGQGSIGGSLVSRVG